MTSKSKSARRKRLPQKDVHIDLDMVLFDMGEDYKTQFLKVIEEAAEFFGAYQDWYDAHLMLKDEITKKWNILAEGADVIQAVMNALYLMGFDRWDIEDSMETCTEKQRERGRIE